MGKLLEMKISKAWEFIRANGKVLLFFAVTVLLSYRIGLTIVYPNPYFWLFILAIPIAFFLLRNSEVGFILIMISVFFADWLFGAGIIPAQLTWLPELVLIAYVFKIIATRKSLIRTPIDIPILIFIGIGIASALLNGKTFVSTLLAFRLDLRFVLMFYILVNLDFDENFFKRMITVLSFLLVIQVPVAFIKFLRYGQMEASIGTYGSFGGGLSTNVLEYLVRQETEQKISNEAEDHADAEHATENVADDVADRGAPCGRRAE